MAYFSGIFIFLQNMIKQKNSNLKCYWLYSSHKQCLSSFALLILQDVCISLDVMKLFSKSQILSQQNTIYLFQHAQVSLDGKQNLVMREIYHISLISTFARLKEKRLSCAWVQTGDAKQTISIIFLGKLNDNKSSLLQLTAYIFYFPKPLSSQVYDTRLT